MVAREDFVPEDLFASIGAAYGEEWGPIGEALGEQAGGAIDKLVDKAFGYGEAAAKAVFGRGDYGRKELQEAGANELRHYTLKGFWPDTKFRTLRDRERKHYMAGMNAYKRKVSASWEDPEPQPEALVKIGQDFGSKTFRAQMEQLQKTLERAGMWDGLVEKSQRIKRENEMKRRRNALRVITYEGKHPALGNTHSSKTGKENLIAGITSGALPKEWAANATEDVRDIIAERLAGVADDVKEGVEAAAGEVSAGAMDAAEKARDEARHAAEEAQDKAKDALGFLAQFG